MKLGGKGFTVVLRISCVWLLAIGVPKVFFVMQSQARQDLIPQREILFISDINGLSNGESSKYSKTVALVTNQMYSQDVSPSSLERLIAQGMRVRRIVVPFSYQRRLVQKWAQQAPFIRRNTPVVSGKREMIFSARTLEGCDALCLDLQDTGVRTDGYVAVLYEALCAARKHNKNLVILDHKNPLGGVMEGWCSRSNSFSGEAKVLSRIPLRHGMTLGELARYMNRSFLDSGVTINIVPVENYDRFSATDSRTMNHYFSRNIRSKEACRCYSFLGILGELSPFDVGLGTSHAFQALLLPEKSNISRDTWKRYSMMLKEHSIESRLWRYYSKRKQQWLLGVRMFIAENVNFSSTRVLAETVLFFKNRGINLMPSADFDRLVGSTVVRRFIDGEISLPSGLREVQEVNRLFFKEAFSSYLYKPLPREVQLA